MIEIEVDPEQKVQSLYAQGYRSGLLRAAIIVLEARLAGGDGLSELLLEAANPAAPEVRS